MHANLHLGNTEYGFGEYVIMPVYSARRAGCVTLIVLMVMIGCANEMTTSKYKKSEVGSFIPMKTNVEKTGGGGGGGEFKYGDIPECSPPTPPSPLSAFLFSLNSPPRPSIQIPLQSAVPT